MNSDSAELRARRSLAGGVFLVFLGLLVAGTVARAPGGALTVAGWALALFGLHTFGRLGRAAPPPQDP